MEAPPAPPSMRTQIFSISCSFSETLVKIICWRSKLDPPLHRSMYYRQRWETWWKYYLYKMVNNAFETPIREFYITRRKPQIPPFIQQSTRLWRQLKCFHFKIIIFFKYFWFHMACTSICCWEKRQLFICGCVAKSQWASTVLTYLLVLKYKFTLIIKYNMSCTRSHFLVYKERHKMCYNPWDSEFR